MTQTLATWLAPLTSFGPVLMVLGGGRHPGDPTVAAFLLTLVPYVGALMTSVGVTLLLRVVLLQQKELAALRPPLQAAKRT